MMESLTLDDYRGFKHLEWSGWGALNILVGANGSGKSAILRSLAMTLSGFTSAFVGPQERVIFSPDDVRRGAKESTISSVLRDEDRTLPSRITMTGGGGYSGYSVLHNPEYERRAEDYRRKIGTVSLDALPIVVSYGVNRSVSEITPEPTQRVQYATASAYLGAFDSASRFQALFEWFRDREDLENQRLARKQEFEDPQLKAVRGAIEKLMPGYTDLHIDREPLRMLLKKAQQELNVNLLSDGEKILLALVGDLARRLAIANPYDPEPLHGRGIAMIDEVDLHLHPGWQRRIVKLLPEVFPGLQFFLTTHSPIVASSAPKGSLYVLRGGGIERVDAYGQEVGLVLDEVFDTAVRDQDVQARIDAMFESLTRGKNDAALEAFGELQKVLGTNDPVLVRAQTRMRGLGIL